MSFENVVALCPREIVSLEPVPRMEGDERSFPFAEDAIEEMVVCLASIEASWAGGDFARLGNALKSIVGLSERTGLPDVAHVARES